jgi:hypothetical protein
MRNSLAGEDLQWGAIRIGKENQRTATGNQMMEVMVVWEWIVEDLEWKVSQSLPESIESAEVNTQIRSAWPLFQEMVIPAVIPNALDSKRLKMERVFMDNANRALGAFDAFAAEDGEAGLAHLQDFAVVSIDKAAK